MQTTSCSFFWGKKKTEARQIIFWLKSTIFWRPLMLIWFFMIKPFLKPNYSNWSHYIGLSIFKSIPPFLWKFYFLSLNESFLKGFRALNLCFFFTNLSLTNFKRVYTSCKGDTFSMHFMTFIWKWYF